MCSLDLNIMCYSSEHSEKLVNEGNHFTSKPLYYVAERRDLVLMKLLLENGAGLSKEFSTGFCHVGIATLL